MADILDAAQTSQTGTPPPPTDVNAPVPPTPPAPEPVEPPPAPMTDAAPAPEPPVSETPPVLENLVVPPPETVPSPAEPEPPAAVAPTPPPPPKPKRKINAGLIISGLLLLFVTLPLAVFYVSQSRQVADIRSLAANRSCFPAGTKVAMGDGTNKNIENVKVGDKVLSRDENGKQSVSTVTGLQHPLRDNLCQINYADGETLKLTADHPIFTTDGWKSINPKLTAVEAPGLAVTSIGKGDKVARTDGTYDEVVSIGCQSQKIQTYNLILGSGAHTYFAGGFMVHNCTADRPIDPVRLKVVEKEYNKARSSPAPGQSPLDAAVAVLKTPQEQAKIDAATALIKERQKSVPGLNVDGFVDAALKTVSAMYPDVGKTCTGSSGCGSNTKCGGGGVCVLNITVPPLPPYGSRVCNPGNGGDVTSSSTSNECKSSCGSAGYGTSSAGTGFCYTTAYNSCTAVNDAANCLNYINPAAQVPQQYNSCIKDGGTAQSCASYLITTATTPGAGTTPSTLTTLPATTPGTGIPPGYSQCIHAGGTQSECAAKLVTALPTGTSGKPLTVTMNCGTFSGNAKALCLENNDYAKTQCGTAAASNGECTKAVTMDTSNPFNVARSIANSTCLAGDQRCLNDIQRQILANYDKNNGTKLATTLPVCYGGAQVDPATGVCNYAKAPCTGLSDATNQQTPGEIVSEPGQGCTYKVECKFPNSNKQLGYQWTLLYTVDGNNCGGGGSTGGGTNPTNPPPQCINIVVYKGGNALSQSDLAKLNVGDTVTLAFTPPANATKVRFAVNPANPPVDSDWHETTTHNTSNNAQFVWDYQLANTTSFNIVAQWFDGTHWN